MTTVPLDAANNNTPPTAPVDLAIGGTPSQAQELAAFDRHLKHFPLGAPSLLSEEDARGLLDLILAAQREHESRCHRALRYYDRRFDGLSEERAKVAAAHVIAQAERHGRAILAAFTPELPPDTRKKIALDSLADAIMCGRLWNYEPDGAGLWLWALAQAQAQVRARRMAKHRAALDAIHSRTMRELGEIGQSFELLSAWHHAAPAA